MASANSEPIRFCARHHHPIAIGGQRINGAAGGGEFAEEDEQANVLVDLVEGKRLRVLEDVLLQIRLAVDGRPLEADGGLPMSGEDDGRGYRCVGSLHARGAGYGCLQAGIVHRLGIEPERRREVDGLLTASLFIEKPMEYSFL